MTQDPQLRFVAAALAMQAMIGKMHAGAAFSRVDLAENAVALADALLAELAKPHR